MEKRRNRIKKFKKERKKFFSSEKSELGKVNIKDILIASIIYGGGGLALTIITGGAIVPALGVAWKAALGRFIIKVTQNNEGKYLTKNNKMESKKTAGLPKTWCKYTNQRVLLLHPSIRKSYCLVVNECYEKGFKVRLTGDGNLRTFEEQDILYGHSRTREQLIKVGVNPDYAQPNLSWKTNARGGDSSHNYGLGTDSCLIIGSRADFNIPVEVAVIFKNHGFEWMFDMIEADKPHFQDLQGYTIKELKQKYASGDVDENKYVNL